MNKKASERFLNFIAQKSMAVAVALANEGRGEPLKVVNSGDGESTVYVYDVIGMYGIQAEEFVKEFAAITSPVIHLRINSPGGDVFAARSMCTAVKEHSSKVVVHIDGVAASAASFLAMQGDEIIIADGAFFMIHLASTFAWGDEMEFEKTRGLLMKIDNSIVKTMAARTKADAEQVTAWMREETWFDDDEAIEHGFADRKADEEPDNSAQNRWDLSPYNTAPESLLAGFGIADTPKENTQEPPAAVFDTEHKRRLLRNADMLLQIG